eukprot:CAMPEP_0116853052 /NCGR_PEP_ID=MMETSP0418-20121206/17671_1 /TAXON_ID=1158023 /ORGANISM="Astrosyne radiata, Strain 13vi08-1A" /LENGTH=777 /DNA_ID=CAMNT_0004485357 /DNA_START=1 /DNA_END=2334 /DNA_ORIENTATION=+
MSQMSQSNRNINNLLSSFTGPPVQVDVNQDAFKTQDKELVGAIDQGTSSTKFMVFTKQGKVAIKAQMEHKQIYPDDAVGWHEHDPLELWRNTCTCIERVTAALKNRARMDLLATTTFRIVSIGITNQRETCIAWDADSGKPYSNAIVWDDVRTTGIARELAHHDGVNRLRSRTGLPLASYFAGTKVKWLIDNVPELARDLQDEQKRANVRFGTVDTWLLYQLTGTKSVDEGAANVGGLFMTDVSNASRWLFMNLETLKWDQELVDTVCAPHSVPLSALPEICPSSHVYATLKDSCGIQGIKDVPLASILGDQQAALFGQCAFDPGEAKNTYGTGLFLMMNTGKDLVPSKHGLLTTVAFQLGKDSDVVYALEGSVSHAGSTIQWLRDQLQLIESAPDTETLSTPQNDGLYMVPAFAGLFAPYWRSDARACIVGMTTSHHKGHVCRAALEALAYQAREVFDAMFADSQVQLKELKVDGGASVNKLLMQFQADMIDVDVVRPTVMETTSMGAAFAAGLAVGVWNDLEEIRALWKADERFSPSMDESDRERNWKGWKKAISKSLGWVDDEKKVEEEGHSEPEGQEQTDVKPLDEPADDQQVQGDDTPGVDTPAAEPVVEEEKAIHEDKAPVEEKVTDEKPDRGVHGTVDDEQPPETDDDDVKAVEEDEDEDEDGAVKPMVIDRGMDDMDFGVVKRERVVAPARPAASYSLVFLLICCLVALTTGMLVGKHHELIQKHVMDFLYPHDHSSCSCCPDFGSDDMEEEEDEEDGDDIDDDDTILK